eukprot:320640-Prymnesium_polylepis.2
MNFIPGASADGDRVHTRGANTERKQTFLCSVRYLRARRLAGAGRLDVWRTPPVSCVCGNARARERAERLTRHLRRAYCPLGPITRLRILPTSSINQSTEHKHHASSENVPRVEYPGESCVSLVSAHRA